MTLQDTINKFKEIYKEKPSRGQLSKEIWEFINISVKIIVG